MLKEAGAEYVIIGHSERRRLFGETDETVNRKLTRLGRGAAHADRLHRRDARGARRERDADVLDRQIKQGLDGLTADQIAALVIAYEPVWAIGTGRNATPAQAARRTRTSARGCASGSAAPRPISAT
jgi:triosephosphate isomerase